MKDDHVSRCAKCLYYFKNFTTLVFSHVGLVSLVVGYTVMGAFTFEALEVNYERQKKLQMVEKLNNVVNELWQLTSNMTLLHQGNFTPIIADRLRLFEIDIVNEVRKCGFNSTNETEVQWTFSGALLYSIIVITTIGYGNVAPRTQWGKVVTILYAVIGIPLMLFCMSNIGDTLAHSFKFVYWKVCCYFCIRAKRAQRARSARYRRYPSMRSRPGSVRHSSHHSSHHSSRHSGGSYRYDDDLSDRSGYYGDDPSCKYVDDELEAYGQRRRLPISAQPKAHYEGGRVSPEHPTARMDANKVPIILNKYVLESKEDLRVDLSPTSKDNCINNLQPLSAASTPSNSAPRSLPRRCASMEPIRHHGGSSSRRKHYMHHHRGHLDDFDFDFFEADSDPGYDVMEMDKEHVTVPIWLCCTLVTGYICGGAILFSIWEDWNFLDSSYFCFVTLTTIGFGDLVPGNAVIRDDSQTTLAICALYLLFGMALLAMSFNLVQEQVSTFMKSIGKMIGIVDDDEDDEDEQ